MSNKDRVKITLATPEKPLDVDAEIAAVNGMVTIEVDSGSVKLTAGMRPADARRLGLALLIASESIGGGA